MNCNDKDILQYLEGNASKEAEMHIETCKECSEAVKGLSVYRKVLPYYREGKRLLESLDEHMKSFDGQKARNLPPGIEELLKTGAGEEAGAEAGGEERKIRPFRRPEKAGAPGEGAGDVRFAAAAIPRDLTKPKRRKSKDEGGEGEK